MNDLYREDEYCMNFTNEDIIEYLVAKAKGYDGVILKLLSANGESLSSISQDEIKFVCFDGDEQSFYISFNKHLTAFFFLNQEFMFIDDMVKEYQTISETYGNIVYEGSLRDKTHEEILNLIFKLFIVLLGAKKILIQETFVSQNDIQYPKCNYEVKLFNDSGIKTSMRFENILFNINE